MQRGDARLSFLGLILYCKLYLYIEHGLDFM